MLNEEKDLREAASCIQRVLNSYENSPNRFTLQSKVQALEAQLRHEIQEKEFWLQKYKELQESNSYTLPILNLEPSSHKSEVPSFSDMFHEPGIGIYCEEKSQSVHNDTSSQYSNTSDTFSDSFPISKRACFRLLQCSDEQCEVFTPHNQSIQTHHRARNNVQMIWDQTPSRVFMVKKPNDSLITSKFLEIAKWLMEEQKHMKIYVEPTVHEELGLKGLITWNSIDDWYEYQREIDFIISFGGDGTVLWVSSLFNRTIPPVISFAMGSLGFLTPFDIQSSHDWLNRVIQGGFHLSLRSRLECTITRKVKDQEKDEILIKQVLNEVVIDRGPSGALFELDCYCDGVTLTKISADGIIIATPTGSTAYSLSAGGSMAHPCVPAMLFTPICPHTLSFRPLIFHDSASLKIIVPKSSRAPFVHVSFDGKSCMQLNRGDSITVRVSSYPLPTVCLQNESEDWFRSVKHNLNWNQRKAQKPYEMKKLQK